MDETGGSLVPPGVSGAPFPDSPLPPKDFSKGFGSWVNDPGFLSPNQSGVSAGRGGGARGFAASVAGCSVFATISACVLLSVEGSAGEATFGW